MRPKSFSEFPTPCDKDYKGSYADRGILRPAAAIAGFSSEGHRMKTGLQITSDMLALQDLLDNEDTDFDNPNVQRMICAWAEELEENRNNKADNIVALIQEWRGRAALRRQEGERLLARAAIDERNAKRLKDHLQFLMMTWGLRRMETARYSLSIAANGGKPALDISPELAAYPDKLPVEYQLTKIEPNKEAIRTALLAGTHIAGCRLLERGESLRIR